MNHCSPALNYIGDLHQENLPGKRKWKKFGPLLACHCFEQVNSPLNYFLKLTRVDEIRVISLNTPTILFPQLTTIDSSVGLGCLLMFLTDDSLL
jgi:hypothetical protein